MQFAFQILSYCEFLDIYLSLVTLLTRVRDKLFLLSFVVGDGNLNSPCGSNDVQDGSNPSQDGTSQTTTTTHVMNGCKQTYNHNQNEPSRGEQEAKQNMQTTREQEAKQKKQSIREQGAEQNKQPARDSPNTESGAEARKIINAAECDPCVDNSADIQGQASNGIIFEEFVGRSQHGSMNYGVPIERSVGESNQVVVSMDDSGGSSIVDRIVAFIVNAYSGSCGRLSFRKD